MIDIACLIVIGVVTWMVGSEGIWGAAQTFLCVLLAALTAMNFYEPLAFQLKAFMPDAYCDYVALVGLFTVMVFGLRFGSEQLAPSYIQVIPTLDSIGRWGFGAATGYLTMAFLLTAIHTAPLPREFLGFKSERNNFFNVAPDRQWLGFVQYISNKSLAWSYRQKVGGLEVNPYAFDSRIDMVGDPSNPYSIRDASGRDMPQVIWPSFPIRYALRRDRLGSNQSTTTAAPVAPIIPPGGGAGKPVVSQPDF